MVVLLGQWNKRQVSNILGKSTKKKKKNTSSEWTAIVSVFSLAGASTGITVIVINV